MPKGSPASAAGAPSRLRSWWDQEGFSLRGTYLIAYGALFAIAALAVFSPFMRTGISFVWLVDGLDQHFNAFAYLGVTVREAARSLFSGGGVQIPLWEWGLGYGGDALTTLSYYVVGDPFALVSIAFPLRLAEVGYAVSIIARLVAAGLAFSFWARNRGCQRGWVLAAALAYAFCAFALFSGSRHPYFVNPLIYLPLVADGLERVIDGRSGSAYVAWIAVACASNYYFFYMIVILAVIYAAVRCGARPGMRAGAFTHTALRAAGLTLLGVGIASVIFIPSAYAFITCSRDVQAAALDALYPTAYYRALPASLFTAASPGFWTHAGVAPLGLIGLVALLARPRRAGGARLLVGLGALFLLVPFFGHAFNGFGYMANRWSFAWPFLACGIAAHELPALAGATVRRRALVGGAVLGTAAVALALDGADPVRLRYGIAAAGLMAATALAVSLAGAGAHGRIRVPARGAVIALTLAAVALMGRYEYLATGYLGQFHAAGGAVASLDAAVEAVAAEAGGASAEGGRFFRLDRPGLVNAPAWRHVSTTSAYWSVMPAGIGDFMQDLASYQFESYTFLGLENRSLLLPLASARYFALTPDTASESAVPYGYEPRVDRLAEGGDALWESRLALPFGYATASWIDRADFDAASIAERQQMLLQGVVVAGTPEVERGLTRIEPVFTDEALPYTVEAVTGGSLEGGVLTAGADGAAIDLSFDCPPDRELYVQLTDAAFTGQASLSWIRAESEGKVGRARMLTNRDAGFDGRTAYLLNIGYATGARSRARLTFSEPGSYRIGELAVISQPVRQIDEQVAALGAAPLTDLAFSTNRVSGRISLDESSMLCLSLPYSPGWTAQVDGETRELVPANGMYTGLLLETGEHAITLSYETPYLRLGTLVSAVSLALAGALAARGRHRREASS